MTTFTNTSEIQEKTSTQMATVTTPPAPAPAPPPPTPLPICIETINAGIAGRGIYHQFSPRQCASIQWHIRSSKADQGIVIEIDQFLYNPFFDYRTYDSRRDLAFTTIVNGTETRLQVFPPAPVLVHSNNLNITVLYNASFSFFNFKYSQHPLASLPVLNNEKRVLYSCSGIPATDLPAVIRCDSILHCHGGEDEMDCALDNGCDLEWTPYNDQCLKFDGADANVYDFHHGMASPRLAHFECESKHQASLAVLPDRAGLLLARQLVKTSGFLRASVSFRRDIAQNKLGHLYRFVWQWGMKNSFIAYDQELFQARFLPLCFTESYMTVTDCAIIDLASEYTYGDGVLLVRQHCDEPVDGYICMKPRTNYTIHPVRSDGVHLTKPTSVVNHFSTKACQDGSLVQTFHRCHWDNEALGSAVDVQWSANDFSLFPCHYGPAVHYSLVCDGKGDCEDSSDEVSCRRPQFPPLVDSTYVCRNLQSISDSKYCDGYKDCFDGSDEEYCRFCTTPEYLVCETNDCMFERHTIYFPYCCHREYKQLFYIPSREGTHVLLDGHGMFTLHTPHNVSTQQCAEGFFKCQQGYCIPTFLLNNGLRDCPLGEDEGVPADDISCPGYYRCQNSGSCLHPTHVCDRIYHCPDKDDEMYCDLTCPQHCVCEGLAFKCSAIIDPLQHLHLRYLDLSHASNVSLYTHWHVMEYLSFLNLSFCNLGHIHIHNMSQLRVLDLGYNVIINLTSLTLQSLPGLTHLVLSGNPFLKVMDDSFTAFITAGQLDRLQTLKMTRVGVSSIKNNAFSPLVDLVLLDIRSNQLQDVEENWLGGLSKLEDLHTDVPKLCCEYFHSTTVRCHAPVDELSSCTDLLAKDIFRVFNWLFSLLALTGNTTVLVYRLCFTKKTPLSPFKILVKNLCVADFLMGVYMLMIGGADAVYREVYVEKEREWRQSVVCTVAGFLSLLSSEMSAFIMCLITLDRVLVFTFPLHKHRHLRCRATFLACCVTWMLGVVLASVPLLAALEFYGQTSICIPLPITRQEFSGQMYTFSIFICLNFVLFVLTGGGQVVIYCAVSKASSSARASHSERDMVLARRLFLVVATNFLCWFPIGVLGLLASGNVAIPGQVNVWAAIFVLPFNSALNPFLYTLNAALEQRRRRQVEERIKRMLGKLQTEIPKWSSSSVEQLIGICARSKLVDNHVLARRLGFAVSDVTLASQCEVDDNACKS